VDTRFKATICRAMAVGTGRFHLSKTFQTCSELEKSLSFPLRLQSLLRKILLDLRKYDTTLSSRCQ